MIICLKDISDDFFSFNVNVNASLKFLWVLIGLSEDTQALRHWQGTWTLRGHYSKGTRRVFKRHSGTRGLEAFVNVNVNVNASLKFLWVLIGLSEDTQALRHWQGTWTLRGHYSKGTRRVFKRHSGTRGLEAFKHFST